MSKIFFAKIKIKDNYLNAVGDDLINSKVFALIISSDDGKNSNAYFDAGSEWSWSVFNNEHTKQYEVIDQIIPSDDIFKKKKVKTVTKEIIKEVPVEKEVIKEIPGEIKYVNNPKPLKLDDMFNQKINRVIINFDNEKGGHPCNMQS